MDTSNELMAIMLAKGYSIQFFPTTDGKITLNVNGPGFASIKPGIQDYKTAVGLAAYWISESNGVPVEAKQEITEIFNSKS